MINILIFGDSITFGKGEFPKIGWAGRLKNYFELEEKDIRNRVYNLGISGDTTCRLLKRIENEIQTRIYSNYPTDKCLIIISIGINDCISVGDVHKCKTNPILFEKNLKLILKIVKKYSNDIIFIGLNPIDEKKTMPFNLNNYLTNFNVRKFNEIIKNISIQENIHFLDYYSYFISQEYEKLLYDGIHPNNKGYDLMYSLLINFLQSDSFDYFLKS